VCAEQRASLEHVTETKVYAQQASYNSTFYSLCPFIGAKGKVQKSVFPDTKYAVGNSECVVEIYLMCSSIFSYKGGPT